jgi:hypothetical protein
MSKKGSPERAANIALIWSFLISPVGLILSVTALKKIRPAEPGYRVALFALWNSVAGLFTGTLLVGVVYYLLVSDLLPL